MHVDVSALQRDSLTRLPNRAMFDAQLDLVLSLVRGTSRSAGVMFVDVDRLKSINDIHGHYTGDDALKKVADELRKTAGSECMPARIGGDEFGVVFPPDYPALSVQRVRAHFESGMAFAIPTARKPLYISANVGVALYPENGTTASELLRSADRSMYAHTRRFSNAATR